MSTAQWTWSARARISLRAVRMSLSSLETFLLQIVAPVSSTAASQ
jgi:hypothetical protein